ncbi:MAG TPA: hypothetical protein VLA89_11565, partial [Gemmatimonadales bacterium]|nr:hypothetical protein [Gemmatimonadales bacterium]
FGCERAAYYGESIRDERGWRLSFPQPERVHFGKAIDVLHMTFMQRLVSTGEIGSVESAVDLAYHAGMFGEWTEEPDTDTFRVQITNAARLLVGEVGHKEQDGVPLDWLPLDGISMQGFNGQSIEIPAMFGERPMVATPDYLWSEDGEITAWLDVKATDRAFSYPDKWLGAEAAVYTLACTMTNGGVAPRRIGYLEYRRNAKPYWHLTWTEEPALLNRLADRYVVRWRKALAAGDPDLLSFNPSRCKECEYSRPIPGVGFEGCPVGMILPSLKEGATDGD